jgi:hypothetical protein
VDKLRAAGIEVTRWLNVVAQLLTREGALMVDSELVSLVDELERLGVKFTTVPRLDGSLRLNCWRLQNAWNNRERINQLMARHIESSSGNAAQIAEFIKTRSSAPA